MDWKEVEAASVEEATREALEQLGAREDEVTIEVIATPRAGVLGLGARQARVRVTRKSAAGAGANPPASTVVEVRRLVNPDMMIEIEADADALLDSLGVHAA